AEQALARIKVRPNPVDDVLKLSYSQAEPKNLPLEIYSSSGQQLYTTQIQDEEGEINIPVRDWPKGAYFIKVLDERNVVVRFLVLHP
ncbi:MAG: T9SS type A sorting domain-containing protein, partial [Bacteroidota bacterium]